LDERGDLKLSNELFTVSISGILMEIIDFEVWCSLAAVISLRDVIRGGYTGCEGDIVV
jgi:hypothetical protein